MLRRKTANEAAFDNCVRAIGEPGPDDILDADPGVRNAEYFFESDDVVADLKSLAKDPLADAVVKKSFSDFMLLGSRRIAAPIEDVREGDVEYARVAAPLRDRSARNLEETV